MKKILLSALCALGFWTMSSNANAQLLADIEGMPPYKLGVTVGVNVSDFTGNACSAKAGFNIGADLMLDASELLNNTYLRVNLLLQRKGSVYDWADDWAGAGPTGMALPKDSKIRTWYIEIPLDYGYAHRINKDWTLLGEMGPYFALGIGGKYNYEIAGKKEKISYFGSDSLDDPKRFDVGWGFAVGGMLNNQHQIKLGYQFGFIDMSKLMKQNRNFMINYTYFFE